MNKDVWNFTLLLPAIFLSIIKLSLKKGVVQIAKVLIGFNLQLNKYFLPKFQ